MNKNRITNQDISVSLKDNQTLIEGIKKTLMQLEQEDDGANNANLNEDDDAQLIKFEQDSIRNMNDLQGINRITAKI